MDKCSGLVHVCLPKIRLYIQNLVEMLRNILEIIEKFEENIGFVEGNA